jgi:hypothetical protein
VLRPIVALLAFAVLAGCGDDDTGPSTTTRVVDEPCPAGTAELAVRDVLPAPPKGMVLLPMRKDQRARAREAFATGFGDKLRSVRLAVVAPPGREVGTAIGVLNLTVSTADGAPAETPTRERLTIAGRPGIIRRNTGSGLVQASGAVGECGVVLLNAPDQASVRRVAAAVRQPN